MESVCILCVSYEEIYRLFSPRDSHTLYAVKLLVQAELKLPDLLDTWKLLPCNPFADTNVQSDETRNYDNVDLHKDPSSLIYKRVEMQSSVRSPSDMR